MCEECTGGECSTSEVIQAARRMPPNIYLLLWVVASRGMPEEKHLMAMGLSHEKLMGLMKEYSTEFQELLQLLRLTDLMDLEALGELLRGQLMLQLAQANKPGDVLKLAQAAKSLPVWALPGGAARHSESFSGSGRGGRGRTGGGLSAEDIALLNGSLAEELEEIRRLRGRNPLNRHMRRAIEALKRKG